MDQDLINRVQELVAEALEVSAEQVSPNLEFGGIKEWDSMGHMGIMLTLEEKFGVPIDAEVIATVTSIPEICDYIQRAGGGSK